MFRLRAIHLALAFVAIAGLGFGMIDAVIIGRPAFPLDDAWIHLQFAFRMAAGDGLAYTGAGWVTGSTAPLWSALLSLGGLLPGRLVPAWSELLGVLALMATVWGVHRLATELVPGRSTSIAGAAALLVATTPWLLWSAASGMEITTFSCLALWGMVWHLRELRRNDAPPRSAVLLAASALARPEGALLLVLAFGERLARSGGRPKRLVQAATAAGLSLVVLLPTLAFYRVAGGSFLPTTFWAKAGGPLDAWPDTRYLRLVLDLLARSQPALALLAAAGILLLVTRLRGPLDRGLLPAGWLVGQAVAYSLMTRPDMPPPMGNFGRYWFPLLPVVVVLGLLALTPASRRLRALGLWRLTLLLVFAMQLPGLISMPAAYAQHVSDVEASDVAAAQWLEPRLDPRALIAVQDVGALGYFLPNRTLDLAGLTSPEVLPVLRGSGNSPGGDWQRRLHQHLQAAQADYLVVFAGSYPQLLRAPGFHQVQRFSNEDNRTMAGQDLVIVATPWCRYPLHPAETPIGPADRAGPLT